MVRVNSIGLRVGKPIKEEDDKCAQFMFDGGSLFIHGSFDQIRSWLHECVTIVNQFEDWDRTRELAAQSSAVPEPVAPTAEMEIPF